MKAEFDGLRTNLMIDITTGDIITYKEIEFTYKTIFDKEIIYIGGSKSSGYGMCELNIEGIYDIDGIKTKLNISILPIYLIWLKSQLIDQNKM